MPQQSHHKGREREPGEGRRGAREEKGKGGGEGSQKGREGEGGVQQGTQSRAGSSGKRGAMKGARKRNEGSTHTTTIGQ